MADQYQYVKLPNGEYGKFAGDATDDVIKSAIQKDFPSAFGDPKAAAMARIEAAKATINSPQGGKDYQTPQSALGRVWDLISQPIGSSPMDVSAGMQSHVPNLGGGGQVQAYKNAQGNSTPGQIINQYANSAPTLAEANSPVATGLKKGGASLARDVFDTSMTQYSPLALATGAGVLGKDKIVQTAGDVAAPILGSTTRGAEKFQQVMAKAKDIPINTDGVSEVAMRTSDLANSGGAMPKVVRDFIKRATDPSKGAVTYSEARDFYNNATRLSADEFNRLTPVMKRQVGEFTQKLGAAIGQAAGQVGEAGNYNQAMDLYRHGKRTEKVLGDIATSVNNYVVKPAVYGAVGGGVGGGIAKMLMNK